MEKAHEHHAQPEKSKGFIDGFLLKKIGSLTCDLPPQFSGQKRRTVIDGNAEEDFVRVRLYRFSHQALQTVTLMDIQRSSDDPEVIKDISVEKFDRYEIGKPSSEAEPLALYNYSQGKSSGLGLVGVALAINGAVKAIHSGRALGISTLDDGVPKTV
jgi:hypothetical protein